ncbi:uncharacterized protein LOC125194608 [Salvia hispanica]|uniref:uncharacterized protein LOC125194608 n=1 Tax=Salvia hispanica TaxID=49212 RepID=UPI0020095555|nr:uncharacterized protein LOC125194608 [Salvia hispanica]
MKIIEASAGALTNFELLDLLRSRGAGKDASRAIATVSQSEFKVFDYLEGTVACNQTREIIVNFVAECQKFDLAKAEILNIVNLRPTSEALLFQSPISYFLSTGNGLTDLACSFCLFSFRQLIEECDSRMMKGKVEELAETITRILPPHPSQVDEANEEAAEGKKKRAEPDQAAEGEEEGEGQEEERD